MPDKTESFSIKFIYDAWYNIQVECSLGEWVIRLNNGFRVEMVEITASLANELISIHKTLGESGAGIIMDRILDENIRNFKFCKMLEQLQCKYTELTMEKYI